MHALSRLRLRAKLALLTGLSALAVVASIGIASSAEVMRCLDALARDYRMTTEKAAA